MSKTDSKKKGIRIGLAIISIILLLLVCIQLFFSFYLDTYVEKRLTSLVSEQSNGQYELKMDELNLSVWDRSFEMQTIRLHPADTASTAPKIYLDGFSVSGIQFLPYFFSNEIQVADVQLSGPVLSFVQNSSDSLTFLKSSGSSSSGEAKPPVIQAGQFKINNGSVNYWKSDQSEKRGELHDFSLEIADVYVDSATLAKEPFIDFSEVQTRTGNIRYLLDSELYAIETDEINFSTAEKQFRVDSLHLIPQFPKYEFAEHIGHQMDRITLKIGQLLLEKTDIEKLKERQLKAEKFTIQNADLEVFHSKMVPPGPETDKTFPHMAFKNLGFPVTIDTIAINQADISYTEHLPDVSIPGTVSFENTNGMLTNVTNDSTVISQEHSIILDVTSEVMGRATLDAYFEFPMHLDGSHSARGTLASMAAQDLNPILEPVGLVRAESGTIHSLQFLMNLNADESSGFTQLVYSDLKIEVLDEDDVNEGGKERIKTFLANILKVKNNNNEEPFRRGDVSFERLQKKSIFNYWWKSLSSGLKENVGI